MTGNKLVSVDFGEDLAQLEKGLFLWRWEILWFSSGAEVTKFSECFSMIKLFYTYLNVTSLIT